MSPSDLAFLKALGISADDVAPAAKMIGGYSAVYETCPQCGAKRHRFLDNGMVFCLSCMAREKREQELYEAQAAAERAQIERLHYGEEEYVGLEANYRGFEIAKLEGRGWNFRSRDVPYRQWMRAESMLDAVRKINRICGPIGPPEEYRHPFLENHCRNCDAPCGNRTWCRSCAKDKFGGW